MIDRPDFHTVDEVYGITRDIPLNYVTRPAVDNLLVDDLTRRQHIVIHGSSKQGKTCLRKHTLAESDYILVQCGQDWDLSALHANILKRAGYVVTQSTKRGVSGRQKILASLSAAIFGAGATAGAESERVRTEESLTSELELDVDDVNDIIAALNRISFNKYIVLEDFHYLTSEVQRAFAVALKAFHESSGFTFIVIGVWREKNRLIVFNGDLTGRVVSVDADLWTTTELTQVIDKGAALLHVSFQETFKTALVSGCFENVYIVQEVCRLACRQAGVFGSQPAKKVVGDGTQVPILIKSVVDLQSARYSSFISTFAEGFQDTRLEMYRWILYPVLSADGNALQEGLSYGYIRRTIQARHPEGADLNLGNLTQALQFAASLQVKKGIKPIVLDYDETGRRLNVVDRGFFIWLRSQDPTELLEMAGLSKNVSDGGGTTPTGAA